MSGPECFKMPDDFSIWILLHIILSFFVFPKEIVSLKMLRVEIPPVTLKGEHTILRCEYELGSNRLYSVVWTKDHEEFYRFVPKDTPKKHSYSLEGFQVDPHNSNDQQVLLRNVNLKASGMYRCEVSAEAPSFTTKHGEGRMEVIALPSEGPEITGEQKVYSVGEVISLNCTSGRSYPPARLSWYVNGLQVGPDYEAVSQNQGLLTSIVGLKFEVKPHHFTEGRMMVRCVSSISTSRNAVREQRVVPAIDNREAMLLVQAGSRVVASVSIWTIVSSFAVQRFLST